MSVPDELADEILAKCGRHCCICRRFDPLHLQVHHIVGRRQGGEDSLDNLIAVCLTCHSDIHARVPFTRRFTPEELKQHRDRTYQLVDEGKLCAATDVGNGIEPALSAFISALAGGAAVGASRSDLPPGQSLSAFAVILLVEAAQSKDGTVLLAENMQGLVAKTKDKSMCDTGNPRSEAECRDALGQLVSLGLVESVGHKEEVFRVTHQGYLLADEIVAAGQMNL